jgi:hypothetical protein
VMLLVHFAVCMQNAQVCTSLGFKEILDK